MLVSLWDVEWQRDKTPLAFIIQKLAVSPIEQQHRLSPVAADTACCLCSQAAGSGPQEGGSHRAEAGQGHLRHPGWPLGCRAHCDCVRLQQGQRSQGQGGLGQAAGESF